VQEHWPEGPHADPDAATERYNADMHASNKALREHFHVDLRVAHVGLAIVFIVSALVGVVWSAVWGLVIGGAFAAVFAVALGVALLTGKAGRDAMRAAYKITFGWADWI
jgi:hypothetical protein